MRQTSRDNARTPMQWDNSPNAGFTTGAKPWLAVNSNYPEVNARQAGEDPNSIYHYYRRLIDLRRKTPALVYGDYKDVDPAHPKIFAYTRTLGKDTYLVVLNFSSDAISYSLPAGLKAGRLETSNLGGSEENTNTLHLKAWDGRVYKLAVSPSGAGSN
jgi:oligo-1,6-glucosidase